MCWRAAGTAVTPLEPRSDSRLWGCVRTPWLNRISVFEHLFRQPVPSDTHSASRKKDVVCRGHEDCSWSAISTGSYGVSMTKNRTNERVNGPFPKRERDGLSARCLDLKSGNTCEHPRYIGVSRHFQISLPLIDTRIVMLPFEAAHRRILGLILPDFGVLPETVGGCSVGGSARILPLSIDYPADTRRGHPFFGDFNECPMPKLRVSNPVSQESTLRGGVRLR
jgi:hypothetical protein